MVPNGRLESWMWFWRRLAVGMSHGCSLQDIDGFSRGYCCDGASGSTEPVGCSWCGAKRAEGSGGCGWVGTTDVVRGSNSGGYARRPNERVTPNAAGTRRGAVFFPGKESCCLVCVAVDEICESSPCTCLLIVRLKEARVA